MSVENCRYGKAKGKRQEARVKRVWAILHFFTQFGFIVFTYLYDEEHSDYEDRWITIGLDETGILRVVIHTFEQTDEDSCLIRIISARKATFNEQQYYQGRKL